MPTELLSHVSVVEIADWRCSLAGRILADLGATVTRVVPPGSAESAEPTDFELWRHDRKNSVMLDLHSAKGQEQLGGLLSSSDVLVQNLGPVHGPGHELDPVSVEQRHPRLVHVAVSDFGWFGSHAGWHLEPLPALAASGALHATGFPDRAPVDAPSPLAHDCASVYAALAAVIGLMERSRSGRGQWVDISVQEASLSGLNPWSIILDDYLRVNPRLPARGTRNADANYWVLPAADGFIRVVVGNARQWDGFKHLMRRPEVFEEPTWSTPGFRSANTDVIRLIAEDRLTDRTRAELVAEAESVGATIGSLHRLSEFVDHPQTRFREFFRYDHPDAPGLPFATPPWRIHRPNDRGSVHRTTRSGGRLLEGVRVVEFGVAAVVPELNWVLSELGADVIKIESFAHPDVLRLSGYPDLDAGFAFNAECRGRRSVALDLSTDEGRRLAFELCTRADLVTENNRGGVLDKLGLGYDAVAAVNPAVIYVASQGYGRGGPFGEMPAYGPLNLAFSGYQWLWNDPDGPYPCGTSLNHPDHIAGKLLAAVVLAALDRRDADGRGALIDLAQAEAGGYLIGDRYLTAVRAGVDPEPVGNRSHEHAPHGVYPSAGDDRWLALSVTTDEQWARLCAAIGRSAPDRWDATAARLAEVRDVDTFVTAWTSTQDPDEATELLQAAGVSAMTVQGPYDHHADPHLADRGAIVETQHSVAGLEHHIGNPMRFSALELRTADAAPCLGEHTAELLSELLDLADETIADLVTRGICR